MRLYSTKEMTPDTIRTTAMALRASTIFDLIDSRNEFILFLSLPNIAYLFLN